MPTMATKETNDTTSETASNRLRNRPRGIIGSGAARCQATNHTAASAATT